MWKSLRAAVEDGVKDFSREAITEFNTTLSDGRKAVQRTAEKLDVEGARDLAGRYLEGPLRSQNSAGRLLRVLSNPAFEADGGDLRAKRSSSDWGSENLSRTASPTKEAKAASVLPRRSSDELGGPWMRPATASAFHSRTGSVLSEWGDSEGDAKHQSASSIPEKSPLAQRRSASVGRERLHSSSSRQKDNESQHSSSTKKFPMQSSLSSSGSAEDVDKLKQVSQELEQKLRVEQMKNKEAKAKLASFTGTLQQRLLQLATEVEARGNALERLREENEGLTSDYNHLRERLSTKEAEAQAAASALKDMKRQPATARGSADCSPADQKVLEESKAAREDLEAQLEAAKVRAKAAAEACAKAEARASIAEAARDAAEAARLGAERARRDTEAEAQAAAAAAEVERSERAAAQGLSVQLKAEADRRAKVFHNAVKAGVAKVQAELEAERDSLEARIQELQQALTEAQQEAAQAQEGRQQALAEAAARLRDAEDAGSLAVGAQEAADAAQISERAARQAVCKAEARIQAADRATAAAEECLQEAVQRAEVAERSASHAREQLDENGRRHAAAIASLEMEIARLESRSEAASAAAWELEARAQASAAASAGATASAQQAQRDAQAKATALEQQLDELRKSQTARFGLPSPSDLLLTLGLDKGFSRTSSAVQMDVEAQKKGLSCPSHNR